MANYDTRKALGLRYHTSSTDKQATVITDMVEIIIQQAEALKELNERVEYLERK